MRDIGRRLISRDAWLGARAERWKRLGRVVLVAAACAALLGGATAPLVTGGPQALSVAHAATAGTGHLWLTGHDDDGHCAWGQSPACDYFKIALDFVRNGSTLPVLVLDSGTEVQTTVSTAYGASAPTLDVVDPSGASFATMPFVDGSGNPLYSAIVVASDSSCGGCDNTTADITAITARKSDIATFFNAGGGILAMSGAANRNTYYGFLPITATGSAVSPPFTVTSYGQGLGLTSTMANCCATHNSFAMPDASSPLQVVEQDSSSMAETLAASNVTIASGGGGFVSATAPDLAVSSSHTGSFVAGTTESYTLAAANAAAAGPTTGTVTLTDTVPAPLTPTSASGAGWSCAIAGQQVVCNYTGAAVNGGSSTPAVTLNASVPHDAAPQTVTNTVTLSDDTDTTTSDKTANDATTIAQSSDLSVSASAPSSVVAGRDVTQTATVSNNGPSDAASPVVTFTVPAHTSFVSLSGPAGWSCDTSGAAASPVACAGSSLALGATAPVTLVAHVDSSAAQGSAINTVVTVASVAADAQPSNNSATASSSVMTSADLALATGLSPVSAIAGRVMTETLLATDNGPSDAQGVVVTTTTPASTTFQSLAAPAGWSCTTPAAGAAGAVSCADGSALGASVSAPFTMTVHVDPSVPAGTTLSATGGATTTTSDPDPSNNQATATNTGATLADLSLGLDASVSPAVAGEPLTYTATITNAGPSDAASPVLTFTLPLRASFVSAAAPAGWTCAAVSGGTAVSCAAARLAASATVALPLTLHVDSGAPQGMVLSASAALSSASPDPNPSDDVTTLTTPVTTSADLALTEDLAPTPPVAGQPLTLTVTATDNGPSDAQGAVVTATLPVSTTFQDLSAPAGWSCAAPAVGGTGTISCADSAALAAGVSAPFTLTLRLAASAPNGATLSATGAASARTADPDPTADRATATATVSASSYLEVSETTSVASAAAGQDIAYTAVVTDTGSSDAANPAIVFTLPSAVSYDTLTTPDGWTCVGPNASGVIACHADRLAAGASATFTLHGHVTGRANAYNALISTVTVSSATDAGVANATSASIVVDAPKSQAQGSFTVRPAGPSPSQAFTPAATATPSARELPKATATPSSGATLIDMSGTSHGVGNGTDHGHNGGPVSTVGTTGSTASSLLPLRVCVVVAPHLRGTLDLTVLHGDRQPLAPHTRGSRSAQRVVYHVSQWAVSNAHGNLCVTINAAYVPAPSAVAVLRLTVHKGGHVTTYQRSVVLVHGTVSPQSAGARPRAGLARPAAHRVSAHQRRHAR